MKLIVLALGFVLLQVGSLALGIHLLIRALRSRSHALGVLGVGILLSHYLLTFGGALLLFRSFSTYPLPILAGAYTLGMILVLGGTLFLLSLSPSRS